MEMRKRDRRSPDQQEIERFLAFVANIRSIGDAELALRKYGRFLPPQLGSATAKDLALREVELEQIFGPQLTPITVRKERVISSVGGVAAKLRRIWTEQDPRRRKWLIFKARDFYQKLADPDHPDDAPALTPFEQAMLHLAQNPDRAGHCINPECPAPFFFAGDSRGRTFCSPKCAGPAKRLAKLRWWRRVGRFAVRGNRGKKNPD